MDLADLDTLPHKIDRLLAHHNALRRGLNLEEIDGAGHPEGTDRAGAEAAALCRNGVAAARRQAPRGQAHPVRGRAGRAARRRPRHLSLRHLVQHGGGAGGDRHRHRARARSAMCSASARPIRPGSGRGRSRPSWTNEIGEEIGRRGKEFGVNTGRKRRCGWFDAVLVRQTVRTCGINGLALTKLDILDGFDSDRGLHRLQAGRQGDRPSAGRRGRAGPGRADLRDHRRLEGADRQCPLLGGSAGPGHQICPPGRGIGGLSDRLAFHQPGTRGYYSGAESVRGLTRYYRKARTVELDMADYYPLIARAIAGLDPSAPGESRRALYERARAALIAQLRSVQPPLSESEITRERLSLEEAVRKVESEAAQRAREASRRRCGRARAGDAFRASTRPGERKPGEAGRPRPPPAPRRAACRRRRATTVRRSGRTASRVRRAICAPMRRRSHGRNRRDRDAGSAAAADPRSRRARRAAVAGHRRQPQAPGVRGFRDIAADADDLGRAAAQANRSARKTYANVPSPSPEFDRLEPSMENRGADPDAPYSYDESAEEAERYAAAAAAVPRPRIGRDREPTKRAARRRGVSVQERDRRRHRADPGRRRRSCGASRWSRRVQRAVQVVAHGGRGAKGQFARRRRSRRFPIASASRRRRDTGRAGGAARRAV